MPCLKGIKDCGREFYMYASDGCPFIAEQINNNINNQTAMNGQPSDAYM
jgi:hypothetical protein